MKPFLIFTAVFLFVGICSVAAQDLIVLRDGNMIEAKVIEISPTEIRYKRSDNLDGPTIVIPADRVLSIKYKNGTQEIINATPAPEQKKNQVKPANTALDPDKFIFAFNTNAGSFLSGPSYGPSLNFEFGKGGFNSEVNLFLPLFGGFGGLATFNWFKHNGVGGFYLGGGIGYIFYSAKEEESYFDATHDRTVSDEYTFIVNIFTVGLNIGWKFVTQSGIYFRTGAYIGLALYNNDRYDLLYSKGYYSPVYLKPDLAIGFCFK